MLSIGFHTDAFNSSYWNFEQCLAWGNRQRLNYIECGTIDGVIDSEDVKHLERVMTGLRKIPGIHDVQRLNKI